MSKTTRRIPTESNYREARKGKQDARGVWERAEFSHAYRQRKGGMLMSPRSTGMWSDEYGATGSRKGSDKAVKRSIKRRERRIAMRDALTA